MLWNRNLFEYKSNRSSIVHQTTAEHCNYQSKRCLCAIHWTGGQCRGHWARRDDGDRRKRLGLAPSREPKNANGSASGVRPVVDGKSKNSWLAADVGIVVEELTCRAWVVAIGRVVGREAGIDVGMLWGSILKVLALKSALHIGLCASRTNSSWCLSCSSVLISFSSFCDSSSRTLVSCTRENNNHIVETRLWQIIYAMLKNIHSIH